MSYVEVAPIPMDAAKLLSTLVRDLDVPNEIARLVTSI
jgi:hypothetical protein